MTNEFTFNAYSYISQQFDIGAKDARYTKAVHLMGLAAEVGELIAKIQKPMRDGTMPDIESIAFEAGDVLWQLDAVCRDHGLTLETVAKLNNEKLQLRFKRGTIKGSGDER